MNRYVALAALATAPIAHAQPTPADGYALEIVLDDIAARDIAISDGNNGFPAGLYIAVGDEVLLFDDGELSIFAANVPNVSGLIFSTDFGDEPALYGVKNAQDDVYRILPDGSAEIFCTLSAGGDINLSELAISTDALDFDGAMYATDYAGAGNNPGRIFRIHPDATWQVVYQNNATSNTGTYFDETLGLVVGDLANGGVDGDGGIWAYNAQLQPELLISTATTDLVDPVNVIPAGGPLFPGDLLVSDYSMDAVFLATIDGDVVPILTDLFVASHVGGDMLLEPDGTLLVTDITNERIYRVVAAGACPADCNADAMLNVLDFVCFQGLFQNGQPEADCNDDGILNILDFVCFQQTFAAGCP